MGTDLNVCGEFPHSYWMEVSQWAGPGASHWLGFRTDDLRQLRGGVSGDYWRGLSSMNSDPAHCQEWKMPDRLPKTGSLKVSQFPGWALAVGVVQLPQLVPEEEGQDGVRPQPKVGGPQPLVQAYQPLLLQRLGETADESSIQQPLWATPWRQAPNHRPMSGRPGTSSPNLQGSTGLAAMAPPSGSFTHATFLA